MKVLVKDIKEFRDKLKSIDNEMEVDVQYWVCYGKPAARKEVRNGDQFIELAIYYNYRKDLVAKITRNRIISENEGCRMSSPIETLQEEFQHVKQASKKNILEKVNELKNIKLESYI